MSTDASGIAVGSKGKGRSGVFILGLCLGKLLFSALAELINTTFFLNDLVFCIVEVF